MSRKIVVIGSCNTDMVINLDRLPLPGETLLGGQFFMNSGGKGANQAVAASKQDVLVHLIASVGNDVFGNDLIKTLSNYNVDVTYIDKLEDTSTGVAMIIIENKDNRIIFYNTINADWSFGDCVDKNICRVHILQMEAVADIVYSVAIAIITKSFCCNHCVYLRLCSKSFAAYVRLGADCAK